MNRYGKRCVLYPRVSTEMQVDGYSLEGQKNMLTRFADREEMIVVDTYEDAGKSGKSIEGRPAFQKMLRDIEDGLDIDYILVYKLSRFGRNAADILNSLELVQSYGVNLICIEEGIDSSQTSGKLLISVLSAVAEIERENIIEQTMNGRREKARQGGWNGGFAPYGYTLEDNKLMIEETEAVAIRKIFELYTSSEIGLGGIANQLNLQGIRKIPRQNGTLEDWTGHFIKLILDNPVYCGKIAYGRRTKEKVKGTKNDYQMKRNDDYILTEGQHKGIVSEEVWEKAHAKRLRTGVKQPSKIGRDRVHLLSGLLKCPVCGSPMYTNKHAWTNKDGTYKEIYYYVCSRNRMVRGKHCEYKAMLKKTDIEPMVIEAIREIVRNEEYAQAIKKRIGVQIDTKAVDKELEGYQAKLKEVDLNKTRLEREIDSLPADAKYRERKLHDMTLRLDSLYDVIVELEEKIEDARLRRDAIKQQAITLENIYKIMVNFDCVYNIINDEEKRNVVTALIKEIEIYRNDESEYPLKRIGLNFPVFKDGGEVTELLWDKGNTVERVDYLFRHNQNRVLVADEVGMGKTLIARGAIVKTARLRIEEKDDLFKVIYICSNQNIANQNIRKLDVTGKNAIGSVSDTRLSMQHLKITEQENDPQIKEGFIQLIPLTPETSFRMTTGGGSVQERALMYAILRRMPDFKGHAASLEKFMIMDAVKAWDGWAKWNFENRVAECEKMTKGVYPQNVIEKILNYQEYESIRDLLLNHLHERRYNKQLTYSNYYVMNKLRVMFARISVSMLEPDLVIMDEFQRFKFLLSSDDSELGILAHSFLSGHDTRVLLLSATPYKLYSTLEEIDENQLDEHYAEFFQVMNFLFDDEVKDIKFKEVWKNYSHALSELKAGDSAIIRMKELAENAMYQGVSRTERISVMDSGDYTDDSSVKHHLQIDENDINSYIQMSRLLSKTDSNHSLPVDYAKSCPYLMSFMKKYKIKEQIEKYYTKYPDEFGSEREQSLLWLNRNKINKYDELPKTNARLEALKEKAFTGGAEKYLWIPPPLPYYEMQGAYKNSKGFSKILVFSAWEMVPRMIGALVSYEAERLTVGKLVHQIKNQDKKNTGYFAEGSRRYPVARLRFNVSNGEVRGMSLFALLYPSKTLSDMYLPIESLNNHESLEVIEKSVRLKLKEKLAIIEEKYGDSGNNKEDARWYYLAPMLMDGVIYAKHWIEDIVWEMNADEEDTTSEVRSSSKDKRNKGFIAHIDKLRSYLDAPEEIHLGRKPEDLLETLVNMVLGSPAICIYRSNGRSTARATSLAKVFVNNFNLPESTAIIDLAYGRCRDDNSHWQNVLKYCKDGCFQAMIDEYIHMLKETAGFQSDGNKYQIVHDMMMDSLKIHTATYIADTYPDFKKRINGADRKSDGCRIRSSYAVGFTKDAGDNSKVVMRKENIRNAFNSPMRPFVLATTSIGQEGLDFHNYCRVIMHWNLPSNPIDLEQREGRINRFKCLAIRQNVADKYGKADGITFKRDIWTEMFEAAKAEKQNDQSELVPFWCFGKNQSVKIERLVPMYPMSKDEVNYERLIKILSLYRLTLGQARQEELLEYLFKEFKDTSGLKKLFIDLSPFSKGKEG